MLGEVRLMDEEFMTPEERREIEGLLQKPVWEPLAGNRPQLAAYLSRADVIGYGGSAGGGKTDLLLGCALSRQKHSLILRKERKDLESMIERCREIVGSKGNYNANLGLWRGLPGGKSLEFGGLKDPGDEQHFRGRPHDFIGYDEADQIPEYQARFVMGWLRTTDPKQTCQAVLCFNPPSDQEGEWLFRFFAPWLDDEYPSPALPGELRYFRMDGDREVECKSDPYEVIDPVRGKVLVKPKSRTFFPARVQDNAALLDRGYADTLASLPSPLKEQLLYGDFKIGRAADAWQVVPLSWAKAAMNRWRPGGERNKLSCFGVDVGMGASDPSAIAPRHGNWFGHLTLLRGQETDSGRKVAAKVLSMHRDNAVVNIDMNSWGLAATEHLQDKLGGLVRGIMFAESSDMTDRSGTLRMANVRAAMYWSMREALDPDLRDARGFDIALPPDEELLKELCSPRYRKVTGTPPRVLIEEKEEVRKRLGRSIDRADAVVEAWWEASGVGSIMTSEDRNKEYDLGPPVRGDGEFVSDEFGGGVLLDDFGDGPEVDREEREWWEYL